MRFPDWFDLRDAEAAFSIDHPRLKNFVQFGGSLKGVRVEGCCLEEGEPSQVVVMYDRELRIIDGKLQALHNVFMVAGDYQRCGIASQMLSRCLPYYAEIGIESVTIPKVSFDGIQVWPKFGFTIAEHLRERYVANVRHIALEKLGSMPDRIPVGVGFNKIESVAKNLAGLALARLGKPIAYTLDLKDSEVIKCLRQYGVPI